MPDKIKVPTEDGMEEKEVFGYFRVLRGRHSEGGRVYEKGSVVPSITNLNKLNAPGALKFQQIEKPAKFNADKSGVITGQEVPAGGAHIAGDKITMDAQTEGLKAEDDPFNSGDKSKDNDLKRDTTDDTLESMTVEELRATAKEEDINLHGASTKAEIIKALKKGRTEEE